MSFHASKKKHVDPDKNPIYERLECKVFVKGVPVHVTYQEFREAVSNWGYNVIKTYYRPASAEAHFTWGMVEFATQKERDDLLRQTKKHRLFNTTLDIQEFKKPTKNEDNHHHQNHNQRHAAQTAVNLPPRPTLPVGFAAKPRAEASDITARSVVGQSSSVTAVILHYLSGSPFGVLKTQNMGHGFFHKQSVTYCKAHRLVCKDVDCKKYLRYNESNIGESMDTRLPKGTQVNCIYRPLDIEIKSVAHPIKFQAKLVWPQASKKPSSQFELQPAVLQDHVVEFMTFGNSSSRVNSSSDGYLYAGSNSSLSQQSNGNPRFGPITTATRQGFSGPDNDSYSLFPQIGLTASASSGASSLFPNLNLNSSNPSLKDIKLKNSLENVDPKEVDSLLEKLRFLINFFKSDCYLEHVERKLLLGLSRDVLRLSEIHGESRIVQEYLRFVEINQISLSQAERDRALAKIRAFIPTLQCKDFSPKLTTTVTKPAPLPSSSSTVPTTILSSTLTEEPKIDTGTIRKIPSKALTVTEVEAQNQMTSSPFHTQEDSSVASDILDSWSDACSSEGIGCNTTASLGVRLNTPDNLLTPRSFSTRTTQQQEEAFRSIPIDEDSKLFKDLSQWVTEYIENMRCVYASPTSNIITAVVYLWKNSVKDGAQLYVDLEDNLLSPHQALSRWRSKFMKDESFRDKLRLLPEALVTMSLNYSWRHFCVKHSLSTDPNDTQLVLSMFSACPVLEIPATTAWAFSNVRGLVIDYLSDAFGVIQTEHGCVLFEKRMVVVAKENILNCSQLTWTHCESLKEELPIGTMVKCHANMERAKNKASYLYATKVYAANWMYDEPFTGFEVPGSSEYWSDCKVNFANIVENNEDLAIVETIGPYGHRNKYRLCFQRALNQSIRSSRRRIQVPNSNQKELATYSKLREFIASSSDSKDASDNSLEPDKYVPCIKLLAAGGITLFSLRKNYAAKKACDIPDLFWESLELILLNCEFYPESDFFEKDMPDPISIFEDFFAACPMTVANHTQLKEIVEDRSSGNFLQSVDLCLRPLNGEVLGIVYDLPETFLNSSYSDLPGSATFGAGVDQHETLSTPSNPSSESVALADPGSVQQLEKLGNCVQTLTATVEELTERVNQIKKKQEEVISAQNALYANAKEFERWKAMVEERFAQKDNQLEQILDLVSKIEERLKMPGTIGTPPIGSEQQHKSKRMVVKISSDSGGGGGFPTNDHGFLSVEHLKHTFPGIVSLKTKQKNSSDIVVYLPVENGVIKPPPHQTDFGDREYIAIIEPRNGQQPTPPGRIVDQHSQAYLHLLAAQRGPQFQNHTGTPLFPPFLTPRF